LSIGLLCGRLWFNSWPGQHSGSLTNWREGAAFALTSANGPISQLPWNLFRLLKCYEEEHQDSELFYLYMPTMILNTG
jgi:hypothetical protein